MLYLIHFDEKLSHAQHYLGYTDDSREVDQRLAQHKSGQGARILRACNENNITYSIVRMMPGDRTEERRIKNCNSLKDYCPVCNPDKYNNHGPVSQLIE